MELFVRRAEMLADYLDFLHFAGRGNPGMEQSIKSIGLQSLPTRFSFFLQNIPFFIREADHNLLVSQAMGFGFFVLIHMALSFHLRSKFLWGIKGGAKPPCKLPGRTMRGASSVPGQPVGWPERSEWLSNRRNLPSILRGKWA